MKKLIYTALVFCSSLQIAMAQQGFKPLFNGKNTSGWHTYGKNYAGKAWEVKDGTLHFNPNIKDKPDRGDLVTDKSYENFHLKLEWKVAKNANSGIIFYIQEDTLKYKNTYSTGLEMQVLDNDGHPDGKITKHRAGDLYDLIQSASEPVKPVGEWNAVDIISEHGNLTFILNGKQIVKTKIWDSEWKKLIAGSKFANWENWGNFKSGKIALQDHNDEVWYRNIRIKEL